MRSSASRQAKIHVNCYRLPLHEGKCVLRPAQKSFSWSHQLARCYGRPNLVERFPIAAGFGPHVSKGASFWAGEPGGWKTAWMSDVMPIGPPPFKIPDPRFRKRLPQCWTRVMHLDVQRNSTAVCRMRRPTDPGCVVTGRA